MDIVWIIVPIVAIAVITWLTHSSARSLGKDRRVTSQRQRLDEAEMLTHSKRPFL